MPEIHPAEGLEHADLRAVYGYWKDIQQGRAMPARKDISLKAISTHLKFIHFYDIVDGGQDYRFRVIGSAVFTGLDKDQTGKLVSEHPDPGVRLRFGIFLNEVNKTKLPVRGLANRITGNKLYDFHIETLWLPLGTGDNIEQILGMSSYKPYN